MNIDEEIKRLNSERDILLVEVVETRNRINELARKVRSLETIKRHASEVLESTGKKTIELAGVDPETEFNDPAQLEIDDLTPVEEALEIVKVPDYDAATKKIKEREPKQTIDIQEDPESY